MTGYHSDQPTRTVVVHCPDWAVLAARRAGVVTSEEPVVVVRANRVVAACPRARSAGVAVGLRRRDAQRRCPGAVVVAHDPDRDARWFEPVASAFDVLTPGVEVSLPGTLAFGTRGPARYLGGERSLAERTGWIAAGAIGGAPVGVGVADGAFSALLAARRAARGADPDRPPVVVESGGSADFLAPVPVSALALAADLTIPGEFTDLLGRLGLRTLGDLAALDGADLLGRFGEVGVLAHRLARGLDARPLSVRRPAPELGAERELDPPADHVDRVALVARALAVELHQHLDDQGLACTRVRVEVETEHGETVARSWRHEGTLTPAAITDRVRWQIEGWLTGGAAAGSNIAGGSPIILLRLIPEEVVAARGRQLGFWGGETLIDERIMKAVARLSGTLGPGAVRVPEFRGGRGPADRVVRVPVEAVDLSAPRPGARPSVAEAPWPGRVPAPAPAVVLDAPEPVEVVDGEGRPVAVTGRAVLSSSPARFTRPGDGSHAVAEWAGPWPVDECWWDPARHRRRARFQMVDESGTAHLLVVESGRWWLEAVYD